MALVVKPTTFRPASEVLEERMDKKIEELHLSKNQYINDALELFVGFDVKFLKGLNGLSSEMGISQADLIQRRLSQWMGRIDAYMEIYGDYPDLTTDLVSQGDFEADYLMHRKNEVEKLEREIAEHAYEVEILGGELEDYQRRLMIKYRLGKTWENSVECKREIEMKQYIEEKYPDAVRKQNEYREKMKAELKAERKPGGKV